MGDILQFGNSSNSSNNKMSVRPSPQPLKTNRAETVGINQPITRKPAERATQSIFIKCVRERIARDWRRGLLSRDLANLYRGVPRAELERIAHEELFGEKEGVA